MQLINIESLADRLPEIKREYQSKKPFKYVVFEDIFYPEKVEAVYKEYPEIKDNTWDGRIYMDQKNKFSKSKFEDNSIMEKVFAELNSSEFLEWLEKVTGIEEILDDPELMGGGLHQSTSGAYLNVHVDFNIHPVTKCHRRLNVLVYMNKDWRDEYEGHLELWNLEGDNCVLLDKIAPLINRCVIFETNEISFHGHPKPLKTPPSVNRKSIATYYYTKSRPQSEIASEHSTVYVNTEGVSGIAKKIFNQSEDIFAEY